MARCWSSSTRHTHHLQYRQRPSQVRVATFTVDTVAPVVTIVEPTDNRFTALAAIDVSGGVVDASPVTVRVDTIDASVTGSAFAATGVALGAGPEVTLRAVATDAAGHTGEATVRLRIDRVAPVIAITGVVPGNSDLNDRLRVVVLSDSEQLPCSRRSSDPLRCQSAAARRCSSRSSPFVTKSVSSSVR
jgi:hypothetical protein